MDTDYKKIADYTIEIAEKMKNCDYIKVEGKGTLMIVGINKKLVDADTGLLAKNGMWGNLPGGEAYCVPSKNSYGFLTVPKGWGGYFPLEHEATFFVNNGRFVRVLSLNEEGKRILELAKSKIVKNSEMIEDLLLSLNLKGINKEAQNYLNGKVKPGVFGNENYDVLAELGIGTNYGITNETIKRFGWSPLLAEKIMNTAHFANGNNKEMGGDNDVDMHVDWVVPITKIDYIKT
jgi:leucyl aminopeptidase (aminopeptidase T)